MIIALAGIVELKAEKYVVVTAGDVGYRVFLGQGTMHKVPDKGLSVKLWTHHYIREDADELYGFLHFAELDLFETLIHVPGIGPKTALGVMDVAPHDQLRKAIAAGDTSYLTKVSGIGRKTAEKIILELREKMAGKGVGEVHAPELRAEMDALDALISLGYSPREAREALAGVKDKDLKAEARIREALKVLGGRS